MSQIKDRLKKLFSTGKDQLEYFVQGAIMGFTESLVARMNELGMTKTDLSKKLKCNPAYITKVLRGGTNFTLESMTKIAMAVDCEVSVSLQPKLSDYQWVSVLKNKDIKKPKTITPFKWTTIERGNITSISQPSLSQPQDRYNNECFFSTST